MQTDSATKYALSLAAFVAVLLSPFYIFGTDSAIGWYDEVNATIPWTAIVARHPHGTFVHEWAGGAGNAQNFLQGTERISLLGVLFHVFTPQGGALLDRCLFMGTLLAGAYLSARRLFDATRRAAAIGAAFSAIGMPGTYGWIMAAGSGWLAPFIFWFALAITDTCDARRAASFAACAGIFTFTGNPAFMLMCVPALLAGMWGLGILHHAQWRQALALFALLAACLLINYYPTILNYYEYLQHASSRYQGFHGTVAELSPTVSERLLVALALISDFWSSRTSGIALVTVFAIAAATATFNRRLSTRLFRGVLCVFLFCFCMEFIAKLWPQLPTARLRWSVPLATLSIVDGWIVAAALSGADTYFANAQKADVGLLRSAARILSGTALVAISVNSLWLLRVTFSDLSAGGGWATFSDYTLLRGLFPTEQRYRIASSHYTSPRAAVAAMHGVDTFDGMSASFPTRRTLFFQQMLQSNPEAPVHTHHQGILSPLTPEMIGALRMAGVGALLEQDRTTPPLAGLDLMAKTDGRSVRLPVHSEKLYSLLGIRGGEIKLLPPLSVWRITDPWDRVFVSTAVAFSDYRIDQREYWLELKTIGRHAALFAHGDQPIAEDLSSADPVATVANWSLDDDGFRFVTNGHAATVVINQVFDGYWQATCDERLLPLAPVNGIMMALAVPASCMKVTVSRRTRFR